MFSSPILSNKFVTIIKNKRFNAYIIILLFQLLRDIVTPTRTKSKHFI